MTAREFAQENGFNANTLIHWKWKLKKELRASGVGAATANHGQPELSEHIGEEHPERSALQFVEVLRASPSSLGDDRIEVVLAIGVTLRVPSTFDEDALRRVLAVVEKR